MSHHRSTVTAAGALLCLAFAGSASAAIPEPEPRPGSGSTDQERPCFMLRADWNDALDGPQPTC